MNFGEHGGAGGDPFSGDPFGTAAPAVQYGTAPTRFGWPPSAPPGEVNTCATLSVVFAFVFAPAGAALGHVALSQIKRRPQPGRRRAVLGLTLSYAFIVLAVVALIVWLLLGTADNTGDRTTGTTPPAPAPGVRSTVITPPPHGRPRVHVTELRVGDCVEIQKNEPDLTRPAADKVYVYRTACKVRDGVFQVRQMATVADQCPPGEYLANEQETVFACFVKYGR